MTEGELLDNVERLCRKLQLYWHHCGDSRRCHGQAGLPDLVIVGRGGVLFAELKDAWNDLSVGQQEWQSRIYHWHYQSGVVRWVLWRPADWESYRIQHELEALVWPRTKKAKSVT